MLKELRTQHRTVIQMAFSGYKNKEIAERLEMSDSTVSQIIRSPLGEAYLKGLQDKAKEATIDVRKKLVSLNSSALKTLERILNPAEKAPHTVQLSAAKDVLDRTGYKAPDKLHVDMTMQTKTDQEIDAEINAMQQSISKTYLQSPGTTPSTTPVPQDKTDPAEPIRIPVNDTFINEQPLQEPFNPDIKEIDSSEQLESSKKSNQDDLSSNCNSPEVHNSATSEESISLLSKIPSDVFKTNA